MQPPLRSVWAAVQEIAHGEKNLHMQTLRQRFCIGKKRDIIRRICFRIADASLPTQINVVMIEQCKGCCTEAGK